MKKEKKTGDFIYWNSSIIFFRTVRYGTITVPYTLLVHYDDLRKYIYVDIIRIILFSSKYIARTVRMEYTVRIV